MSILEFIDLGEQPIANGFVSQGQLACLNFREPMFALCAGMCEDTYLVSLMEFVESRMLFNEHYAYHSSGSQTMRDHFGTIADMIKEKFDPKRVLEIGSNDGVFLRHFPMDITASRGSCAVEPCENFAEITRQMGYRTYNDFWDMNLATQILDDVGPMDVVYAANCMCHIPNIVAAFSAVEHVLADDGVFIFEDPSLDNMLTRNSYDQIYDEHAHLFSALALQRLLDMVDLVIYRIDFIPVHGGSQRIYAKKGCSGAFPIESSVSQTLSDEWTQGVAHRPTLLEFAKQVEQSKIELVDLLRRLKSDGKKIIGYGATSKSTVVYNYCGIGPDLIDYVVDTTPNKQGMFTPGTHIPIISPEDGMNGSVDYAFLGAWNYESEILAKESAFCDRGGKFITHVPTVRVI